MSYARQQDFAKAATFVPAIPAQFSGLARMVCRRVAAEDAAAEVLLAQLGVRAVAAALPAPPWAPAADCTLHRLAAAWRDRMPAQWRLGFHTDLEPRGRFGSIVEVRAVATTLPRQLPRRVAMRNCDGVEMSGRPGVCLNVRTFMEE